MFRRGVVFVVTWVCFPRIRGDVPQPPGAPHHHSLFSPHTRGCSPGEQELLEQFDVFPAYAGMFLPSLRPVGGGGGFPRIRGDVPIQPLASC